MHSNAIILNNNLINDYLNNKNNQQLIEYLKECFKIVPNAETGQPNRIIITKGTIDSLSSLLLKLTVDVIDLTTEVFRSLRNAVAFNPDVQIIIAEDPYILEATFNVLQQCPKSNECVKIILQFLINFIAKNPENSTKVWNKFNKPIIELFPEPQCSYYVSALFYNIVYLNRSILNASDCNQLYNYVLEGVASCDQNIYYTFLLELYLQDCNFMNVYDTFDLGRRITLLLALADFVSNNNEDFTLSLENLQGLVIKFKNSSDCILKTETNFVDGVEPQEVVLLLEILASLSSQERYSNVLQADKSLIVNCAFLLRNIHTLGKESQNVFTPIQKLSEVASTNNETRKNPVFGFKADLIRLLGNVCWAHKTNQDTLRELECIPLFLDCCNIDARNPFIIQWAILAIRNVCHKNPENQEIIAGLTKRGVVNSSTLQEMGLTLHDDGTNKIVMGPLPERK